MRATLFLIVMLPGLAQAWTSARVYPSGGGLAYTYDAESTRIPDFSYAGYQEGCQPLPGVIPVVATLTPVAGDNTTNINNALAAVAALPLQANGYRGALLLKPGTYNIGGVVQVGGSGVVLRGSGSGTNAAVDSILYSTRTDFDATNDRGEYSVVMLGNIPYSGNGLRAVGATVDITTAWVKVGDDSFQVTDVTPFAVGDLIVINQPISDAWLATVGYGGTAGAPNWTAGGSIVQERRITAIDAATKTLHINGGSFQHLKQSLGQCTVGKMDPNRFAQRSGIEDLHVDITHASATDEHHAKNAITISQGLHCWVRNTACRYYWHSAVMVTSALYCSVQGNQGSNFAGIVTGERAYTFSAEGNASHILFTQNAAYGGRHNYICNTGFTNSGVVFYDNDSYDSLASIEAHMHWSMGILFDNIRDYNAADKDAMGVYCRGSYGTNHGWACANCVIWNTFEEKGNILCQKPPTAQNYVIGCTAGKLITGSNPPAPFTQPTGFVEGANTPGLVPASLYVAQLAARSDCPMAGSPTPTATRSRTATASPSRTPSPSATQTTTRSPTGSATASVTLSRTRSATPTRSASSTATPEVTLTASLSASVTPSSTSSITPGAPSATPSSTLTPSPSLSRTRSVTPSLTPSSTPSATLTLTSSFSASATASTSPTASASATATPPVTLTASASATSTLTVTLALSPSASITKTPTATLTASSGASATATASATPLADSPTFTVTWTATATPTRSVSATPSVSVTLTATPSSSATPSRTRTLSLAGSPSCTTTLSSTFSPSPTLTVTLTPLGAAATATLTPPSTPESSPASSGGPLVIRQVLPLPNPNPRRLWIDLEGPADRVRISLWSVGLTELLAGESGALSAGGHEVPLPDGAERLPSGVLYCRVEAFQGGRQAVPRTAKCLQLR